MAVRLFDLNIEEVLDNWEVSHAIREVISNALDEQSPVGDERHRDRRRWVPSAGPSATSAAGFKIEHFTLNENKEKLARDEGVIGKFGVGLKDALATFHRRESTSRFARRTAPHRTTETSKHNFSAISTLHVQYEDEPIDMCGHRGRSGGRHRRADGRGQEPLPSIQRRRGSGGDSLRRDIEPGARTGAAFTSPESSHREESNFLFSYNVTNLTDTMKKRLNRERLNVGRTTYSDRVKSILEVRVRRGGRGVDRGNHQATIRAASRRDPVDRGDVHALTSLHLRKPVILVTEKSCTRIQT